MSQSRMFLQSSTTISLCVEFSAAVLGWKKLLTHLEQTQHTPSVPVSSASQPPFLQAHSHFVGSNSNKQELSGPPNPFPGTLATHGYFTQRWMPYFLPSARLCFHFSFPRLSAVPALEFLSLDILGNGGQGSFVEGLTYALRDDWSAHDSTHWMQGNSSLFFCDNHKCLQTLSNISRLAKSPTVRTREQRKL